jgi:spore coat polysaccharide biosynthesis protein SpsF (cytidylyltransferase family)
MIKVIIYIQARSTSNRFPRKIFERIDGKEVLQYVIDAATESCLYINKHYDKNHIVAKTVLLLPSNDKELINRYGTTNLYFAGDENNVLDRFYQANQIYEGNYIVRLTSDCPLIPSYLISKCINTCVKNAFDYVSNVDPIARSCPDGHDVEVFSKRALEWAKKEALEEAEKEHVTLILRSSKIPDYFKVGHIIGHTYETDKKISLDTKDDLENIISEYEKIKKCIDEAINKSGKKSIYRI